MSHIEITQITVGEVTLKSARRPSLIASIDQVLGLMVEIPAALLVVAEIVILFAGVVARYGLRQPLVWSDELARSCSCGWRCSVPRSRSAAPSICG